MPTLNWIGKDAVINHHHDVKFRLLKDVAEHGSGDPGTGNLIVEVSLLRFRGQQKLGNNPNQHEHERNKKAHFR